MARCDARECGKTAIGGFRTITGLVTYWCDEHKGRFVRVATSRGRYLTTNDSGDIEAKDTVHPLRGNGLDAETPQLAEADPISPAGLSMVGANCIPYSSLALAESRLSRDNLKSNGLA
jgi:hypothetical protein